MGPAALGGWSLLTLLALAPLPAADPVAALADDPDTAPHDDAAPAAALPPGLPLGGGVGYVFRPAERGQGDDRQHGIAATAALDSPPLLWGFGLRAEGVVLSVFGTDTQPGSLVTLAGGAGITYRFDDTGVAVCAGLSPLVAAITDNDAQVVVPGGLGSMTMRVPLGLASSLDGRLLVVALLDERVPLQAAATIGVSVALDRLVAGALAGIDPVALLLPGG
jgi:hypothetical protein